ncbi:trypsin-like serine protease [Chryseobacterium caseinilyticum]|uniref:Trypsin-like peptidase domain-containing protein n=1 Tax=Chryseobacterium caseinilyticum TaxID=2771428 RepID=A0ABR8ZGP2_9FLAO|nr:trypsin-like serine protease [Chryseobacterium caseinilyticum]MBD8084254.1 trypsin-like peptidase domain-containing protein [Chryseobacterium caseinilyticum]
MKIINILAIVIFSLYSCQNATSKKVFKEISLVNKIDFNDDKLNQPRFACGFLMQYNNETFAVTAKHLLQIIKPKEMKTLAFENHIKSWSFYVLDKKDKTVTTNSLLNKNESENLNDKSSYSNDWLVFSVKQNNSDVEVLEIRDKPLLVGEKLYVVGWTRTMEDGPQRVYEFEYYKTINNRMLLKDVVVPEKFGGLSGAPVVDEYGKLVGIVSGGTEDPDTKKKYFSPCTLDNLLSFLDQYQKRKK